MDIDKGQLPAHLHAAYLDTRYRIFTGRGDIVLRIGEHQPAFASWLRSQSATQCALLTAWNPASQRLPVQVNRARQTTLVDALLRHGLRCMPALNEAHVVDATSCEWNEESVLALDITFDAAMSMAREYQQLAFVWVDHRAAPRLITTAPE